MNYDDVESRIEIDFKIMTGQNCEASKGLDGKIVSREDAFKNNIIPFDMCSRKTGCICMLNAIPKRDENGYIIRKLQ